MRQPRGKLCINVLTMSQISTFLHPSAYFDVFSLHLNDFDILERLFSHYPRYDLRHSRNTRAPDKPIMRTTKRKCAFEQKDGKQEEDSASDGYLHHPRYFFRHSRNIRTPDRATICRNAKRKCKLQQQDDGEQEVLLSSTTEGDRDNRKLLPPFLQIPGEIRNTIYSYALDEEITYVPPKTGKMPTSPGAAKFEKDGREVNQLQYVCRQLRDECEALELKYSTLVFPMPSAASLKPFSEIHSGLEVALGFLRQVSAPRSYWIRRVEIERLKRYGPATECVLAFVELADFCKKHPKVNVRYTYGDSISLAVNEHGILDADIHALGHCLSIQKAFFDAEALSLLHDRNFYHCIKAWKHGRPTDGRTTTIHPDEGPFNSEDSYRAPNLTYRFVARLAYWRSRPLKLSTPTVEDIRKAAEGSSDLLPEHRRYIFDFTERACEAQGFLARLVERQEYAPLASEKEGALYCEWYL
ncbi:hypothetical protein M011DRAFT_68162 [Sporormia fimetaria CBS 119925]|uniref:Uncharacterized protein n=1 Tax=Sporormia fimetaria CBS 119925 TaxID=1340428 RepID=A0A6A6VAC4_9PLEO|nr:hypothetical protein M011DRAFT_68162 [Sporormia fimetaria CBS 119925]